MPPRKGGGYTSTLYVKCAACGYKSRAQKKDLVKRTSHCGQVMRLEFERHPRVKELTGER